MGKLILKDKTEIEILPGASLTAVTAVVSDFSALGTVAEALAKESNLDAVQFMSGEVVTGEYADMKLESPLFRSVDIAGGKVQAVFSIREKTEIEKRLDNVEARADVTEEALQEVILANMGGEA